MGGVDCAFLEDNTENWMSEKETGPFLFSIGNRIRDANVCTSSHKWLRFQNDQKAKHRINVNEVFFLTDYQSHRMTSRWANGRASKRVSEYVTLFECFVPLNIKFHYHVFARVCCDVQDASIRDVYVCRCVCVRDFLLTTSDVCWNEHPNSNQRKAR